MRISDCSSDVCSSDLQGFTTLLYLPAKPPFDLMMGGREERKGLKLYIKRVFIMDAAEELLPNYLRFVRGVVDADDLPLNVSRELLQHNRQLERIRSEEHTSELQSLMRISYAVFCLKKKNTKIN